MLKYSTRFFYYPDNKHDDIIIIMPGRMAERLQCLPQAQTLSVSKPCLESGIRRMVIKLSHVHLVGFLGNVVGYLPFFSKGQKTRGPVCKLWTSKFSHQLISQRVSHGQLPW